jgi:hypothetical protein
MNPLQKRCHRSSAIVGVGVGERRHLTFFATISLDNILQFFKGLLQGLMDPVMIADRFRISSAAPQLMCVKRLVSTFIFCFPVVMPSKTKQIVVPHPQSGGISGTVSDSNDDIVSGAAAVPKASFNSPAVEVGVGDTDTWRPPRSTQHLGSDYSSNTYGLNACGESLGTRNAPI